MEFKNILVRMIFSIIEKDYTDGALREHVKKKLIEIDNEIEELKKIEVSIKLNEKESPPGSTIPEEAFPGENIFKLI